MSKFELEEIEIEGAIHKFYKLVKDDKCFYDEFISDVKDKFDISDDAEESILDELDALIEDISLNNPVPPKKHKQLKKRPKNFPYTDYEIRTGKTRLRIYYIKDKGTGKIIVLGEYKEGDKTQQKTIKRMRKIAKEYHDFTKNK